MLRALNFLLSQGAALGQAAEEADDNHYPGNIDLLIIFQEEEKHWGSQIAS